MFALCLTLIVLALGPLVGDRLSRGSLRAGADGFVLVTVLGLVVLSLLPEAVSEAGAVGMLAAAAAFMLPWVAERQFRKFEQTTHKALLILAATALGLHGVADGAVLREASQAGETAVLVGLILHRAGSSLALWWLMISSLGKRFSIMVLVGLGAATVVGYGAAHWGETLGHSTFSGFWQGIAAGSLLHIVMHPLGHADLSDKTVKHGHRIGTVLGLVGLAGFLLPALEHLGHDHGHVHGHGLDFLTRLGMHGLELSPVLIALLFIGLVFALIVRKIPPAEALRSGLKSGLHAGLILWIGTSLFLTDDHLPEIETGLNTALLVVWVIFALGFLTREGARGFIGQTGHSHRCGSHEEVA